MPSPAGLSARRSSPRSASSSTDSGFDRIRHYLDEALAFSAIFVIPGLFGTVVLGERVLRFYRPEFGQGTQILLVLILAYLADVFASQFTNVLNGIDRPDAAFRVNGLFIVVNMVLNVVLVWQIGWFGAAFATASSSLLRAVAGYWVLESILGGVSIPFGELPPGRRSARDGWCSVPRCRIRTEWSRGDRLARRVRRRRVFRGVTGDCPRIRSKAFSLVPRAA
ncbi:lipopolysaccharide biosynthesis protein [Halomicroarcula sp. GCM10025710]